MVIIRREFAQTSGADVPASDFVTDIHMCLSVGRIPG